MEQWIIDLQKKHAAPSKKVAPVDRGQFNTPGKPPAVSQVEVSDQCKPCANGEHNLCNGRDCGCRWCTQEERE